MNYKPTYRRWICPCRPMDKPVILQRDEFTMRLLEVAPADETDCTITENLEIKFKEDRIFKVIGNQIIPLSAINGKEVEIEGSSEKDAKDALDKQGDGSIGGGKRKRPEDVIDDRNNFNIDISCSDTGSDPKKPQSSSKTDFVSHTLLITFVVCSPGCC